MQAEIDRKPVDAALKIPIDDLSASVAKTSSATTGIVFCCCKLIPSTVSSTYVANKVPKISKVFAKFGQIFYISLAVVIMPLYIHYRIYDNSLMEQHSLVDILNAIADSKSLDIFQAIAKGRVESEVLKQKEGLSKKQYYVRTGQLLNSGLIQRIKGQFSLTNLGAVIYHAQLIMEAGVNNYWKLKALIQFRGQDK